VILLFWSFTPELSLISVAPKIDASIAAHHHPSSQHLPSFPSLFPPPQHSNAHASPSHLKFETSIFYLLQKMYALHRGKEALYCFCVGGMLGYSKAQCTHQKLYINEMKK